MPTDQELKQQLALALDATLEPMHELERRGYTVGIFPTTLRTVDGEQPDGTLKTTIFNLKVFEQITEEL